MKIARTWRCYPFFHWQTNKNSWTHNSYLCHVLEKGHFNFKFIFVRDCFISIITMNKGKFHWKFNKRRIFLSIQSETEFFSLVFLVECLFSKVREHKVHLNFRLKEQPSGQAHSFVLFSLYFFFRKTISRFWSCCLRKFPKEIEISCRLKARHLLLI